MKILAIRGKNLASLEGEFEMDFTVEPLKSAGIFAITGNTGSGKSTLLDALCLALFDNTPRMSQAGESNVAIVDVKNKTIYQKDCRALLRRGTGEGYAEVDFRSLGGENFRAKWIVKRAREKADGFLQNTEIRLWNLSAKVEVQGRKTELLAQISKHIGLTFDQFTRAVLLAQGDFATFLKAKQSEKAELLEKLTGTDVYSRISISIYEKTKAAEQAYLAVLERMQGVELLTNEQVEALNVEKNDLLQNNALLKTALSILTAKIKWIDDREVLNKHIGEAEKSLTDACIAIAGAKPRYDYVTEIENVQEIRDEFNEFQQTKKQLDKNRIDHKQQSSIFEHNEQTLVEIIKAYDILEKEKTDFDRWLTQVEPDIIKARALDVQLTGAKANGIETEKEYQSSLSFNTQISKNIEMLAKELDTTQITLNQLISWFDKYKMHQAIFAQVDLIVTLLNDTQASKEQSRNNANRQKENVAILETEIGKLATLKEKSERLNRLLPTEIVVLRAKLADGVPCPVCGSLHHPAQKISEEQSLQETELNKAKQAVSEETVRLAKSIKDRELEISRLSALAGNYAQLSADTMEKLEAYLSAIPSWKEIFERNELQSNLQKAAQQWAQNTEKKAKTESMMHHNNTLLQNERKKLTEAQSDLLIKEKKRNDAAAMVNRLQKERMQLLQGKSVAEISDFYATKKNELNEKLKISAEKKNALHSGHELLKGIISQMISEIARLEAQESSLHKKIEQWMSAKPVTWERLAALLAGDNQWLIGEKRWLSQLKEQETTAKATLEERNKNLAAHLQAEIKPQDESETKETMSEKYLAQNTEYEQNIKRNTELDFLFAQHQKGLEKIKNLEKELLEKGSLSENWKKLNELFGSASGSKFKEIAQGYTLDALLAYANKHLKELSKRYELQRIPNSLALQVADLDMLGEIRTVHSLSGGESFLISLALALGLSSLSSNKMNVESLFIDEGFGSLDIDTLRVALDALERIQTHGRKIGVISHVAEMTERIATQVCVIRAANGRSVVKVIG